MKRKLFPVFVLFVVSVLQAQSMFKPGYVLKSEHDTIFGEVDYRDDEIMSGICHFRHAVGDPVLTFMPNEIYGYRFLNGRCFISKEIKSKKVFLEFLVNGRVDLYYIRDKNGDKYFLSKDSLGLVEIPYKKEMIEKDKQEYLYESKTHIGVLNYFMHDAPGILSKITEIEKPDHKNLISLVEYYHNAVCDGEKCIVYKKNPYPIKVNLEFSIGYFNSIKETFNFKQGYFKAAVYTHIWLPRESENLFLRTGLGYMTINTADYKNTILYIPVQIEYIYPKGIFRPKFAVGANLYQGLEDYDGFATMTFCCMAGINIKINKSCFWSINYELGTPFYVLPTEHSLSTGLYFQL